MPSFFALSLLTTATFTGLACRGPIFNSTVESQSCCIEKMSPSNSNMFVPDIGDLPDIRHLDSEETAVPLLSSQTQINEFQDRIEPLKNEIIRLMELVDDDDENCNLLITYILSNENNLFFKLAVIEFFSQLGLNEYKTNFIDIVLSSDIDIFADWYKNVLEISCKSDNLLLANRAKDILHYYSKGFSKI